MEEIYYEYKNFNPQGPRGPRHHGPVLVNRHSRISIHKALAGLDLRKCLNGQLDIRISIHKALAGLDIGKNPSCLFIYISIHKALAGLDIFCGVFYITYKISIHKALAGLDSCITQAQEENIYFNPQGPRAPRRPMDGLRRCRWTFQSTRPSRASTIQGCQR